MTERRSPSVRRDLNDMIRDPAGNVSEAKVWANIFKGSMVWVFLHHAAEVIRDWTVLLVFVGALLMPELLKKLMTMKLGKISRVSTTREESNTLTTTTKEAP